MKAAGWRIEGVGPGRQPFRLDADQVVNTLPPQLLPELLGEAMPEAYARRIASFPDPSGALVLYGAVPRRLLPAHCGLHAQLEWEKPGSLFVSISEEGDGRAPEGQATLIASVFTPARPWFNLPEPEYQQRKQQEDKRYGFRGSGSRHGSSPCLGLPPRGGHDAAVSALSGAAGQPPQTI